MTAPIWLQIAVTMDFIGACSLYGIVVYEVAKDVMAWKWEWDLVLMDFLIVITGGALAIIGIGLYQTCLV